ncbi:hypothetical protein [Gracilibacillus sp. YIM 98692]|uniref:hypothetical protein n=1 Tax=Gracilibacillus sp. YIM 98692 TaxID=2663532 RepID=UPI0013D2F145|nr:hypothetical protein [Gracilibacillus sp. YIM 98692]
MEEKERFKELIDEIHSLPEPNYEVDFDSRKQKRIHDNLMNFSRSHGKKKRKKMIMKRMTAGFAGVVACLIFTIVTLSIADNDKNNASDLDSQNRKEMEEFANDNEDVKDSEQIRTDQPERQDTTVNFEEKQYQEIVEIYHNYQPVTEGTEVDYIDEEFGVIYYNNGISIVKEVKQIAHWPVDEKGNRITPSKDQILAAIKGNIGALRDKNNLNMEAPFSTEYQTNIDHKIDELYRLKSYSDSYKPIVEWMNSTISYFEESKRLLSDNPENAKASYKKGLNNIKEFMRVLEELE